jgi:hypothetical protein
MVVDESASAIFSGEGSHHMTTLCYYDTANQSPHIPLAAYTAQATLSMVAFPRSIVVGEALARRLATPLMQCSPMTHPRPAFPRNRMATGTDAMAATTLEVVKVDSRPRAGTVESAHPTKKRYMLPDRTRPVFLCKADNSEGAVQL